MIFSFTCPFFSFLSKRAPALSTDCARMISQSEFITGGNDATLQVLRESCVNPLLGFKHFKGENRGLFPM